MHLPLQRIISFLQNPIMPLRVRLQGQVKNFDMYLPYLHGKSGLEIGGPSAIFRKRRALPVYEQVEKLDNCDFSPSTVWAKHTQSFVFNPRKAPGKTLFCDGSALADIPDQTYDFLLSSHNLEHFANPVKALREWHRVLKSDGALILVLPYYLGTFDRRRLPTSVDHMFSDWDKNIGEDDLTHLPEILDKHDLSMDPAAGNLNQFHKRSLDNKLNRCLHHHVFDEHNSRELLSRSGFEVLSFAFRLPFNLCFLARKISS
ncbi:MAG: methyltransferase domain-containing protein [Terriglobales bacterium]|jgi:SAM-dependent methyltransferase